MKPSIELQRRTPAADLSTNYGHNAQTSVQHLNLPGSPQNEQVDEVTDTGFNVGENDPSSNTPEVYFHMKPIVR